MTNNVDLTIPAKRYFTLDELCGLLQISPYGFAQWQHDHGVVVGYGGERYTRSDVVKLLKLRSTFAPYPADGESGSDGDPQVTVQEIRDSLKDLLADLDKELG
ncbi:TPA: hypothetical protein ACFRHF_000531 [Neisseria lactamica]|uniref:DNA-binding protein n=1 Tax=Neisseria lactamica (strain 020-06) TaxID=489653 RepID=E4ZED2_NEIL0|nr:hypothetical protein [Neisseria lactamica]CBN87717.1 hypothetical protein NLA_15040 [Neisseria lactamica 020-06]